MPIMAKNTKKVLPPFVDGDMFPYPVYGMCCVCACVCVCVHDVQCWRQLGQRLISRVGDFWPVPNIISFKHPTEVTAA